MGEVLAVVVLTLIIPIIQMGKQARQRLSNLLRFPESELGLHHPRLFGSTRPQNDTHGLPREWVMVLTGP